MYIYIYECIIANIILRIYIYISYILFHFTFPFVDDVYTCKEKTSPYVATGALGFKGKLPGISPVRGP